GYVDRCPHRTHVGGRTGDVAAGVSSVACRCARRPSLRLTRRAGGVAPDPAHIIRRLATTSAFVNRRAAATDRRANQRAFRASNEAADTCAGRGGSANDHRALTPRRIVTPIGFIDPVALTVIHSVAVAVVDSFALRA